jgi:hypothetical protein
MDKAFEIKKTYLANLIQIGKADGNTDEWEERYIDSIALRLSIPDADMANIKVSPQKFVTTLPDTLAQRIEFFYNLLFMMGINNEITDDEKELCKQIGFKLCFNPMLMDDMINIVSDNLGKNILLMKL